MLSVPLVTDRLSQRPFTHADMEEGHALWSDPEVGRFTGGAHTDLQRTGDLIAAHVRLQEHHGMSLWAVEERGSGRIVGEVGLQPLEARGPEIEIGWAFLPAVWGRGYATEAARPWLDAAFTVFGLDRVIATILPDNTASQRVAERLGMEVEGRRHIHDAEHLIYVATAAPRTP